MRFGAYETAPQRVHTATGLGFVLPLALLSCSSRTALRSGRFSFGHEWVGGGGNSLSFTGVLGQSNGQESHTYRNRSGKTCLFSSDIGPHLTSILGNTAQGFASALHFTTTNSPSRYHRCCHLPLGIPALARIGTPSHRCQAST